MPSLTVAVQHLLIVALCISSSSLIQSLASASNCVLGISTGPPSKVALLLSSFSTHVSSQDCLFVLLTTRAAEHQVHFAHLDDLVDFVSINFTEADIPLINMKRFEFYLDYLLHSDTGRSCSNVMYTDTYDVFFQGDPFSAQKYAEVLTFTAESKKIGEDIWNAQWIYNCYGLESLVRLHNETIANAGVTLGPYSSIVAYTGHLLDEFESRSFFQKHHPGIDGNGLFRYGGFISSDSVHSCWTDQGFLNYLLHVTYAHSDMLVSSPSNFESTVFTVGHNRPGVDFRWQDNTLLRLHSDGTIDIPTVVHQLNRFPEYWQSALDLYALR